MSGLPSCARIAPSSNSIIEWITLCGCTTTWIFSSGTPKRWCASMTSRPLFIIVAQSTVIFAPIFQVGCPSACLTVAR